MEGGDEGDPADEVPGLLLGEDDDELLGGRIRRRAGSLERGAWGMSAALPAVAVGAVLDDGLPGVDGDVMVFGDGAWRSRGDGLGCLTMRAVGGGLPRHDAAGGHGTGVLPDKTIRLLAFILVRALLRDLDYGLLSFVWMEVTVGMELGAGSTGQGV